MKLMLEDLRIGNILKEGVVTSLNRNGTDTVGFSNGAFLDIFDVTPKVITGQTIVELMFFKLPLGEFDYTMYVPGKNLNIDANKTNHGHYVTEVVDPGNPSNNILIGIFIHQLQNAYFFLTKEELPLGHGH